MTTLRDLLLDSRDGEWGAGEPFPGGVDVSIIRGTDFAAARTGTTGKIPARVLDEKYLRRKALQPNDIIIETAGGTKDQPTGRTLYVTQRLLSALPHPAVCASFARFLRIDPTKASPEFVFWLLQDLYFRRELLQFHTQHTGVARFQFTTFADNYKLDLPNRYTQERIAATLSAYDNLIEVNHRRIAILEEMAWRLFDEWFVHYRYPGHESVPLVETELGVVPDGWRPGKLGDFLTLSYGKALKSDQRQPGPIAVFGSSGVVGAHDKSLVCGPGIIVGRKGNVGAIHWSTGDFFPIDTVFFVETSLPLRWIYQLLKRQTFLNSDAAVPGLNREQAYSMKVLRPSEALLARYAAWVEPLLSESELLHQQIYCLRAARDLLLPKLISGEIELGRANEVLAEAAE